MLYLFNKHYLDGGDMQLNERETKILEWLDEKLITDIEIIDISELSVDMDKFIIGTALNERVCRAACDHLEEKCKESEYKVQGKEGYTAGKWILVDLADLIVHLFVKDERETYNLEKLWADGVLIRPEVLNDTE